jgi:hypothetical protein
MRLKKPIAKIKKDEMIFGKTKAEMKKCKVCKPKRKAK